MKVLKIMSIIGIILSALGIWFGLSSIIEGDTDLSIGLGFIMFLGTGYFLALSIVALMK